MVVNKDDDEIIGFNMIGLYVIELINEILLL